MIVFLALICCIFQVSVEEQVAMKIVEEPSSYGWNNMWNQPHQQEAVEPRLAMRVSPANFSGPPHLRKLSHKCYKMEDVNYSYELCHFSNITQQERSLRWNPYHGILGVYQEWEIENNTFVAMSYREGDRCGTSFRRVRVLFVCGEKNALANVTEPDTCHYEVKFITPYVCHPHAMLVYPTLSRKTQMTWDNLEGALQEGEITPQGYKKKLAKLFEDAGYYLSLSKKKELAKKAKDEEKHKDDLTNGQFPSLAKCSEEYNKLKNEVEGLRTLLALQGPQRGETTHQNSVAQNNNKSAEIPNH